MTPLPARTAMPKRAEVCHSHEDAAPSTDGHAAQQDGDLARTGVEAPAIAAAGMAAIAAGALLLRRRTGL